MIVVARTRFGTPIYIDWFSSSTGEKVFRFQQFECDEGTFDASMVFSLLAVKELRKRQMLPAFVVEYARHYEGILLKLDGVQQMEDVLKIESAFDRANYAETLLDITFRD